MLLVCLLGAGQCVDYYFCRWTDCSRSECSGFYPIVTARAMHWSCSIQVKSCASPFCRASLFPPFRFFFPPFTALRDDIKPCIRLRRSKTETHCFPPLRYLSQDLILVQGISGYGWVTIALVCCRNAFNRVAALAFPYTPLWPIRWFYAGHWLTSCYFLLLVFISTNYGKYVMYNKQGNKYINSGFSGSSPTGPATYC